MRVGDNVSVMNPNPPPIIPTPYQLRFSGFLHPWAAPSSRIEGTARDGMGLLDETMGFPSAVTNLQALI
jgi:hypothetical protein